MHSLYLYMKETEKRLGDHCHKSQELLIEEIQRIVWK